MKFSAGLIGNGSDVLGYDTYISQDHNWGPRSVILIPEKDFKKQKQKILHLFEEKLPHEFLGFPTNFSQPVTTYLVQRMEKVTSQKVNPYIEIYTLKKFFNITSALIRMCQLRILIG